ncbi:MAG: exodeoxyribonuclease VII small subunit [Bacillota bacterium]|nr:exodeoxyribonuclease VII small subunit [Bacillota bacterium]
MEPMNFDASLAKLEEIVAELESGQLSLEESLAMFEQGVALSVFCQKELKKTESKVSKLIQKINGDIELEPFED